jgi:CDP-diacylglycerol--glycerol-3-phosphate 3-phosphatidyltransferase
VMAANRGGKAKTVTQSVALILYLLPLPGWAHTVAMVVMAAALVITVVTGVDYVLAAIRLRRDARTTA